MKKFALLAVVAGLTLGSCSSDDSELPEDNNLIIPENYTFERGNASTVNYEGQTTRIHMVAELIASFNDFDNATAESLSNMFSNTNNPFSSTTFNESDKSIKSKVAASNLYFSTNSVESTEIKNDFEAFIEEQMTIVKANKDELAAPGVAGQIADGSRVRYVNPQGFEMNQLFAKGLIGALITDQMLNHYLSPTVLDAGDNVLQNNNAVVVEGENYTTMEHYWDEAYGYLYGHSSIPGANPNTALGSSGDRLLFNYLGSVENDPDFAGIAEIIFNAFKIGRAAIVAGNYDLRNEQIAIIKENVSKVIGIRSVYYLQSGKRLLAENRTGAAYNDLSEGFGFIYSLRFTQNPLTNTPYLEKSEIDSLLDVLMSDYGLWDLTPGTLDALSETIAAEFDFTVAQAAE